MIKSTATVAIAACLALATVNLSFAQQSRMINVGMCLQDEVQLGGVKWKVSAVEFLERFGPLKQAAID